MANKDKEISRLNGIYKNMLVNAGVELIEGWGSLQDEHTVAIKQDRGAAEPDKTISAYKILVWPPQVTAPGNWEGRGGRGFRGKASIDRTTNQLL